MCRHSGQTLHSRSCWLSSVRTMTPGYKRWHSATARSCGKRLPSSGKDDKIESILATDDLKVLLLRNFHKGHLFSSQQGMVCAFGPKMAEELWSRECYVAGKRYEAQAVAASHLGFIGNGDFVGFQT